MNLEMDRKLSDLTHKDESIDEIALQHHGIIGMKWGVLRPRGSDGTVGGTGDTQPWKLARQKSSGKSKSGGSPKLGTSSKKPTPAVKKSAPAVKKAPTPKKSWIEKKIAKRSDKMEKKLTPSVEVEAKEGKKLVKISDVPTETLRKLTDRMNVEENYLAAIAKKQARMATVKEERVATTLIKTFAKDYVTTFLRTYAQQKSKSYAADLIARSKARKAEAASENITKPKPATETTKPKTKEKEVVVKADTPKVKKNKAATTPEPEIVRKRRMDRYKKG